MRSQQSRRTPALSAATFAAAALASAFQVGKAEAAAVERSVPSSARILFEEGTYAEFGVHFVNPKQSGSGAELSALGMPGFTVEGDTGNLFKSYHYMAGAIKGDVTDRLSLALIFDQPYGADSRYGSGPMTGAIPGLTIDYEGSSVNLDSNQLTLVAGYDVHENVKLFAGVRAQSIKVSTNLPIVGPAFGLAGYSAESDTDYGYGYLVGAAYSRPEIALRVALSYYSQIHHTLSLTEWDGVAIPGVQAGGKTEDNITTPQHVLLEFQTGVAPKTLVFGSVHWVDWSQFDTQPLSYAALTGQPLLVYEKAQWTYALGVARQLTDSLAAAISFDHEPAVDTEMPTLGPFDGRTTATVALSYDAKPISIVGSLTYGKLGDAKNLLQTEYDQGKAWAAGLRVGYSF